MRVDRRTRRDIALSFGGPSCSSICASSVVASAFVRASGAGTKGNECRICDRNRECSAPRLLPLCWSDFNDPHTLITSCFAMIDVSVGEVQMSHPGTE